MSLPNLSAQALWYNEMPTSSTAAERVFAIMRGMESSLKASMTEASFEQELMFRVNHWLVEEKLAAADAAMSF